MAAPCQEGAARLRRYHKLRVLLGGWWRKENRPPSDRLFRPYKDLPDEARDFLVKCASPPPRFADTGFHVRRMRQGGRLARAAVGPCMQSDLKPSCGHPSLWS